MKNAIAFLLLTTLAFPAPPEAKIAGPDKGRPGDILILSSDGTADFADWSIDASDVAVPKDDPVAALEATAETLRAAGFKVESPASDAPPKFLVLTTDGDSATTLHASSNEPGSARVAHDANPAAS